MSTEKGISIVEIIFAVGVTVLVITGTVSLMIKSTSVKTSSQQRKNASELAETLIEDLVNDEKYHQDSFWTSGFGPTSGVVGDYTYTIGFSQVTTSSCTATTCVNAIINVGWGNSETLTVKRLFSR